MASYRPPPSKSFDLDLTIISAKHLKNVNWKNGHLNPYAVFWVDPDRRLATKSDDSGSTRPVWNERFTLPLTSPLYESFLTLEIFHSKPSETPKPLVGTLRVPLSDLADSNDSNRIRTVEVIRPSGRPHGNIRLKIAVRERPSSTDYHISPPPSYFYSSAPPPQHIRDYRGYLPSPYSSSFSASALAPAPAPAPAQSPLPPSPYHYGSYSDSYSGYYPGYYSSPPPHPRPFLDRPMNYGGSCGPSAPVDYTPYDHKPRIGKTGMGTGLAVAGAMGGLALDEELKYEEEKIAKKVEKDVAARDDYSNYPADY